MKNVKTLFAVFAMACCSLTAFADFQINFRSNPYTLLSGSDEGVSVTGQGYNGPQHGIQGGTINVSVAGPMTFTFGQCHYSNGDIKVKKNGADLTTVNNKNASTCDSQTSYDHYTTWTYTGGEAELSFVLGSSVYLPYFFAETTQVEPGGRTFEDFILNLQSSTLPACPANVVSMDGQFFDGQHGYKNFVAVINVDGPVKFTIGGCTYANNPSIATFSSATEGVIGTINVKEPGCYPSGIATFVYTGGEDQITFTGGEYTPFLKAEAVEVIPQVTVSYYDCDGSTLIGSESIDGGSSLAYKYGASDVTVASGKAFRGWFDGAGETACKIAEGTMVETDLALYAHATDIEVAAVGKTFYYDLTKTYFYQEDHELLTITNGKYQNNHGWFFGENATIAIEVAGNALVQFKLCRYGNTGTLSCVDGNSNIRWENLLICLL